MTFENYLMAKMEEQRFILNVKSYKKKIKKKRGGGCFVFPLSKATGI